MNRHFFSGLLSLLILMGCLKGRAQDTTNTIGNVSIASPTAAALGKYGDIPVSYNTGLPQISIPIYTVKAGSLSLPISLSYHASGLKVQEEASWVGAGWALNAGGMITRTVVGAADDQGLQTSSNCTNGHYSAYGYNSYLFVIDPYAPNGAAYDGYWTDDLNFQHGVKDGEPDLYFFNFGGYSGKFYFNDDRTPVFVPEEDFKVQPDLNNGIGSVGFQGFVVTTPDGVRYYFGMTGNYSSSVRPIEISLPANTVTGPAYSNSAVSSWFLNKIVSADGVDSITFSYAQEQFSEYSLSMFPMSSITGTGLYPSIGGYGMIKNFITGVRLTGINFPNGHITFTPSPSPRSDLDAYNPTVFTGQPNTISGTNLYPSYSLGSIAISNSSSFCQKDSFYFGYFHDNVNTLNGLLSGYSNNNIQSDTYRLRLDSVKETSCDGMASVPPYRFSYYSELVPRKLSFGLDHWGFYNGVTTNQCLIPTYSQASSAGVPIQTFAGANRDASWPAMRGGALNQITYPTGGYTNFTFEPNTTWVNATNYVTTNRISGMCVGCTGNATPDTVPLISVGNSYQFIMANLQPGSNGTVEVFPVGSFTPTYTGPAVAVGQTDTSYGIIPPGNYNVIAYKNTVECCGGLNFTVSVNEELPVSYTGNDTVGGLRIKSIVNYDAISPDSVVTNYNYNGGGTHSSGILYSRPVYVQSIRNDAFGWVWGPLDGNSGCNMSAASYYISPTSISPMSTIQGNHIGYNEVDVSQPGNGHTTYRYYGSDYWDYIISDVCTRNINIAVPCTTAIPNTPAPPEPFEPMRGELQYVGQFNQAGQELKEVDYTPLYVFDSLVTPGRKYLNISPVMAAFTSYSLQSARKVQTTTVTITSDPSSSNQVSQTSTVYYGSPYHHQPTRQVTTTSTGDSLATNTVYSMDFQVASCNAIPDSLPYFISLINADSVTFFKDIDIPLPSNVTAHYDTLANLERHVNLTHLQYLQYRLRSFSGTPNLQHTCDSTAEVSADTALRPILRMQDKFVITPVEVTQWRDNRLLHATFNKYDTSLNPVGFVYPDRTQLINLTAASGTFSPAVVSGSTISKDSRYLDETLYQFSTSNPQQVTPHSGVTVSYIWDYLNKMPIAKVTNAAVSQIAYTSFEADGSGSWTIGSASRDTGSITGSHCYNLTNGTCSRSGLTSSASYVVSYWSKTGSSFSISGSTAVVQGKTIGGWTYFEHTVTGVTTETVSGTGDIDELRLYPSTAQMTTYTYTPLVGMTTQCDVDNRVTYYQYDALGRMKVILDQDHNVIKTVQYHYQGQ